MTASKNNSSDWRQALLGQIRSICSEQTQREMDGTYGYDYKASISAISHFEIIAKGINAKSAADYMEQLRIKIQYAQANCINPGEYSGGKATYGTLLSNMQYWYDNHYCN
ncbi:hypothetical protein QKW35_06585 [Pontibacterium granulatum]|uniref:hypothetical protein n=1 Tax=Pontibacterium granulatum TaxID=2036029 RepID=UPI00249C389F|nr:hypothetical protein [Pontibacterium granulatum]MDI3324038.1 hypothetical protein [Pontibacterium granulatum]